MSDRTNVVLAIIVATLVLLGLAAWSGMVALGILGVSVSYFEAVAVMALAKVVRGFLNLGVARPTE